jgi:hypothetical protein
MSGYHTYIRIFIQVNSTILHVLFSTSVCHLCLSISAVQITPYFFIFLEIITSVLLNHVILAKLGHGYIAFLCDQSEQA